jgi:hypothetical protein
MRYCNGIVVLIPWCDATNNRNHSRYSFKGNVDRRRVKRQIRRSLRSMGMHPPSWWLDYYIRHRSYVSDGPT